MSDSAVFEILFSFIQLINNLSTTQDFITTMNLGLFLALRGTKWSFLLLRVEKHNWHMLRVKRVEMMKEGTK